MARDKWKTPQPTLTGYNVWAFRRLGEAKGKKPGPLAEWIIDRWIEQNREFLAREYGVKHEQYEGSKRVRNLDSRR